MAAYIEELAPLETAVPGDVNGFMFGDEHSEVRGICVCWSPTYRVIREAIESGASMIVCHEVPFFFHSNSPWFENRKTETKLPNLERFKLLLQHGICIYRAHSNWDVVPRHGNCDAFGTALGFSREVARGKLSRVYEVAPVSVQDLAEHVKNCLQMNKVRVAGDLSKVVTRVGTACGGLGQIFNFPEELVRLGAEVAVMGEVLDYTMRHALELDLPLIETTHIGSENFGLRNLTQLLQERFPELNVT
ncbi:MAG: Nif3-like dinuclear metal center hexameric protein, partial [Anaerolineae bacterium]